MPKRTLVTSPTGMSITERINGLRQEEGNAETTEVVPFVQAIGGALLVVSKQWQDPAWWRVPDRENCLRISPGLCGCCEQH